MQGAPEPSRESTREVARPRAAPAAQAGRLTPVGAPGGAEVIESLYAKRIEIYPRAQIGDSLGWFQRWRWVLVWPGDEPGLSDRH